MIGGRILLICGAVAIAGCATKQLEVRSIADPGAKFRDGGGQVAEARALLAMGSAGLALEAFRKLQREQPTNPEVYAGIAACYAEMGRHDLERKNLEAALAFAPKSPKLLNGLASSLDVQGEHAEAAEVRQEAKLTASPKFSVSILQKQQDLPSTPQLASVTVKLPPPRPVTLKSLPPPHDIVAAAGQVSQERSSNGPRLERLSSGEVALVTTGKALWASAPTSRSRASAAVQWQPLTKGVEHANIRLLNAARRQGLAARTRQSLLDRGWRDIRIGDASRVRRESVVFYSAGQEGMARRLAAHFDCKAVRVEKAGALVVLLGRELTASKAIRRSA
jgi:tetratricopeptide (TPR) repeat protein